MVSRWRGNCLISDGWLMLEETAVWTPESLDVLMDAFVNKELIDDSVAVLRAWRSSKQLRQWGGRGGVVAHQI